MASPKEAISTDNIPQEVTGLATELNLTKNQLEQFDWLQHQDWTPGDNCPDCDSSLAIEMSLNEEIVSAMPDSQAYQFKQAGDRLATLGYICADCEAELYIHPLLKIFFQTPPQ